jgi:hypothetical protein
MTGVRTPAGQAESSAADRKPVDRTIRHSDGANGNNTAEQTSKALGTGSQFTPGSSAYTYEEDRRRRLRRGRLVGFSMCVPLWALGVIPLARESIDGRESADAVLVYLAVGAISLGVAAVIRGGYVLLRKRQFWSPWVFLVAAVVAIVGYTVQSAGEEVPVADAQALESRAE